MAQQEARAKAGRVTHPALDHEALNVATARERLFPLECALRAFGPAVSEGAGRGERVAP
jgi:hypothetical protein